MHRGLLMPVYLRTFFFFFARSELCYWNLVREHISVFKSQKLRLVQNPLNSITKMRVCRISWWHFRYLFTTFIFYSAALKAYLIQSSWYLDCLSFRTVSRRHCCIFYYIYVTSVSVPASSEASGIFLTYTVRPELTFKMLGKKPRLGRGLFVKSLPFPFLKVCDRKIPCHWMSLNTLSQFTM